MAVRRRWRSDTKSEGSSPPAAAPMGTAGSSLHDSPTTDDQQTAFAPCLRSSFSAPAGFAARPPWATSGLTWLTLPSFERSSKKSAKGRPRSKRSRRCSSIPRRRPGRLPPAGGLARWQLRRRRALRPPPRPSRLAAEAAAPEPVFPNLSFHGFGDINYDYASNRYNFRFLPAGLNRLHRHLANLFQCEHPLGERAFRPIAPSTLDAGSGALPLRLQSRSRVEPGRRPFPHRAGLLQRHFPYSSWFATGHRPALVPRIRGLRRHPVRSAWRGSSSRTARSPSGGANLHYFVQVGNGRSYTPPTSPANPTQADEVAEGPKAFNLAFNVKPTWAPAGKPAELLPPSRHSPSCRSERWPGGVRRQSGESAVGRGKHQQCSPVYSADGFDFRTEGFLIAHTPTGGSVHRTVATYAEAGRKWGDWTPTFGSPT